MEETRQSKLMDKEIKIKYRVEGNKISTEILIEKEDTLINVINAFDKAINSFKEKVINDPRLKDLSEKEFNEQTKILKIKDLK